MAGFGDPNAAMGGFNMQPPLMGAPSSTYSPLGFGHRGIDTAFAMYGAPMLQQILGPNNFLPQQFPSQFVLDQMVSAKYQRSALANLAAARGTDQTSIHNSLMNMRSRFDRTPLSDLGRAQLNNAAGYINSPIGQMMASSLLGPQNAEDLFFGRRGSAVQLANAVNQIGFYRPDSVTGGDRMTGRSLEVFSDQLYRNLYGPDADLNDVSGFSAGRAGTIMSELAQRGLLPQSMGKLSVQQRERELFTRDSAGKRELNADIKKLGLSNEIETALGNNLPTDEIAKLEGGADAVRKIDATRVGNSLKQYTQALSAVREIFGANGITNAPMQQLVAAMDALTQNGGSSMSPGRIENLMRRTQMASSGAGVSLEGLMGLTARSGAIADQYGLSRGIAAESVIAAMETGQALRDTGGFRPGFGRLDPTKAIAFTADQTLRVAASRSGRYAGALARVAAENAGKAGFEKTNIYAMIEAMKRGDTSYYDETLKRTVNIQEELGRNPDQFANRLTEEAGVGRAQFGAYVRDPASQEFQSAIAGAMGAGTQASELKTILGARLATNTDLSSRIKGDFTPEQRAAIAKGISGNLSGALVDRVNTTMKPEERIAALRDSYEQAVIDDVKRRNPGMAPAQVMAEARKLYSAGDSNILGLKTEDDIRNYLGQLQSEASIITKGETGTDLATLQQLLNSRQVSETARRRGINITRAGMSDASTLGDGSNLLQRFSDMMGGTNNEPILDQLLGTVNTVADQDKLIKTVAGGKEGLEKAFKAMQADYDAATINKTEDKEKLVKETTAANFANKKSQFDGTAVEETLKNKTQYMTTGELGQRLAAGANETNIRKYKAAYMDATGATADQTNELFADPKKAYETMAGMPGMVDRLSKAGIDLQVGSDTITQADWRELVMRNDMFKDASPEQRAKLRAIGTLGQELDDGKVGGKTLLGALGHGENANSAALTKSIDAILKRDGGSSDELRAQLRAAGIVGEKAEHVVNMTEFSRNVNELGGFSAAGVENASQRAHVAGRQTALETAVKTGRVTGPKGSVADLIARKERKEKLTDDEEKTLKAAFESEESYEAALKDVNLGKGAKNAKGEDYKSTKEAVDDIRKTSGELSGSASAGKDPTGIGAAIASSIGAPIAGAIKEAFSGEIKLDNVTINNVNVDFQKLIAGVVDASKSAVAATTKESGPIELSGAITLKNLQTAIAQFVTTPSFEPTPGGNAPVANSPTAPA